MLDTNFYEKACLVKLCAMAQSMTELRGSAELLRTPFRGSSQNMIMVKFGPAPILLVA